MYLMRTCYIMEATGKSFGSVGMDVRFGSAPIAALCNSQRRLAERWGHERAQTVQRRLLELAAVDAADIGRLPRANVVSAAHGEAVIDFGGEVVVRGAITAGDGTSGRIRITDVAVTRKG